ncbi:hypothetical protein CP8484711_0315, partial [Chlamydia psittaci 84-8471/1]
TNALNKSKWKNFTTLNNYKSIQKDLFLKKQIENETN